MLQICLEEDGHFWGQIQSGTGQQKPGRLVALLNVRYMEIHSPTSNRPIVDHGGKSRITAGLKKYACFLTLDPNTANNDLMLSEENRKVTCVVFKFQSYPDHPDRFDRVCQVLCRESVCGRCYWEIEWRGNIVFISVSYKSISRKEWSDECRFGGNDQSWSLTCYRSSYSFRHNNIWIKLPVKPIISSRVEVFYDNIRRVGVYDDIYRIGVYVDESAGTLSFYSISDTMSLIHTEQTTFTQPLYPGFGFGSVFTVYPGSSVKLRDSRRNKYTGVGGWAPWRLVQGRHRRERGYASRADPGAQGAMAGQGVRGAMAKSIVQAAMAGQGVRGAMAEHTVYRAMVGQGVQEAMAKYTAHVAMAGQGARGAMAEHTVHKAMMGQEARGAMAESTVHG
ncbi:Stonustoxin subunit alpha [Labeo rohita]|uniref:Stonustoxin subunit alpha n=1 Tax=Labeo rohita TaxID=84645 RepID=A0ABQ8L3Y9_LABRO|nr:Stonustoxin subunit alpha [Labeo rohita]